MFCNVFPLNKPTDVPAESVELLMLGARTAHRLLCQRKRKAEQTTASEGLPCNSSHIKYTTLPTLKMQRCHTEYKYEPNTKSQQIYIVTLCCLRRHS